MAGKLLELGLDSVSRARQSGLPDAPPSSRVIHVDLTTVWQESRRIPHGTVRVERGLVGALALANVPDLRFCRFNKPRGAFLPVSREEALAAVMQPSVSEGGREAKGALHWNGLRQAGRALERWAKARIREPWRRFVHRPRRRRTLRRSVHEDIIEPGSLLFIAGELQRHDLGVLRQMHKAGVRLVFVFYDLLGVLAADDPRAADPDAVDIPGTDFVIRHATLLLSISDFSRSELTRYAATRGVALPPIHVFRLGEDISRFAGDARPAAGLASGGFVLAVGDVVARKNYGLLLSVWRDLHRRLGPDCPCLVIAGRVGAEGTAFVRAVDDDKLLRDRIRILANVDDATLLWLYRNCRFTVFPSLLEGFGLPVIESLAVGKACIASSTSAIPEASGGLALHLEPTALETWTDAVERLWNDATELHRHENAIAERYRPISWGDSAEQVLQIIRQTPQ